MSDGLRTRIGTEVTTIHGNRLRRFKDGWSPLEGANWDRWIVYTDEELVKNFILTERLADD